MLFVGSDRLANVGRVHVLEMEDHGLAVWTEYGPDFETGARLEFVDCRVRNQGLESGAEFAPAGALLRHLSFVGRRRQPGQYAANRRHLTGRPLYGRARRLPAAELDERKERRVF